MGGAKLLKWRLAAEGAKLLKSRAALILTSPPGRDPILVSAYFLVCRWGLFISLSFAYLLGSRGRGGGDARSFSNTVLRRTKIAGRRAVYPGVRVS